MKKLAFLVALLTSAIIINNQLRSIYNLWQKKEFMVKAQKELEFQKKENEELKNKLSLVKRENFVEKEARDKLFLLKQGESRVIVPSVTPGHPATSKPKSDNWEMWLKLFFP